MNSLIIRGLIFTCLKRILHLTKMQNMCRSFLLVGAVLVSSGGETITNEKTQVNISLYGSGSSNTSDNNLVDNVTDLPINKSETKNETETGLVENHSVILFDDDGNEKGNVKPSILAGENGEQGDVLRTSTNHSDVNDLLNLLISLGGDINVGGFLGNNDGILRNLILGQKGILGNFLNGKSRIFGGEKSLLDNFLDGKQILVGSANGFLKNLLGIGQVLLFEEKGLLRNLLGEKNNLFSSKILDGEKGILKGGDYRVIKRFFNEDNSLLNSFLGKDNSVLNSFLGKDNSVLNSFLGKDNDFLNSFLGKDNGLNSFLGKDNSLLNSFLEILGVDKYLLDILSDVKKNLLRSLLEGERGGNGIFSELKSVLGNHLTGDGGPNKPFLKDAKDLINGAIKYVSNYATGLLKRVSQLAKRLSDVLKGVDLKDPKALEKALAALPLNQVCGFCSTLVDPSTSAACRDYCQRGPCRWEF